jgi:hypothetical protein
MHRLLPIIAISLAACATVPASAGPTAGLGQVAVVDGVTIRPLAVVEDSRCPRDVQCVWAGRLVILAEIGYRGGSESFRGRMTLGQALVFGRETVTLVSATPGKTAGSIIDPRAYRFSFAVQRTS